MLSRDKDKDYDADYLETVIDSSRLCGDWEGAMKGVKRYAHIFDVGMAQQTIQHPNLNTVLAYYWVCIAESLLENNLDYVNAIMCVKRSQASDPDYSDSMICLSRIILDVSKSLFLSDETNRNTQSTEPQNSQAKAEDMNPDTILQPVIEKLPGSEVDLLYKALSSSEYGHRNVLLAALSILPFLSIHKIVSDALLCVRQGIKMTPIELLKRWILATCKHLLASVKLEGIFQEFFDGIRTECRLWMSLDAVATRICIYELMNDKYMARNDILYVIKSVREASEVQKTLHRIPSICRNIIVLVTCKLPLIEQDLNLWEDAMVSFRKCIAIHSMDDFFSVRSFLPLPLLIGIIVESSLHLIKKAYNIHQKYLAKTLDKSQLMEDYNDISILEVHDSLGEALNLLNSAREMMSSDLSNLNANATTRRLRSNSISSNNTVKSSLSFMDMRVNNQPQTNSLFQENPVLSGRMSIKSIDPISISQTILLPAISTDPRQLARIASGKVIGVLIAGILKFKSHYEIESTVNMEINRKFDYLVETAEVLEWSLSEEILVDVDLLLFTALAMKDIGRYEEAIALLSQAHKEILATVYPKNFVGSKGRREKEKKAGRSKKKNRKTDHSLLGDEQDRKNTTSTPRRPSLSISSRSTLDNNKANGLVSMNNVDSNRMLDHKQASSLPEDVKNRKEGEAKDRHKDINNDDDNNGNDDGDSNDDDSEEDENTTHYYRDKQHNTSSLSGKKETTMGMEKKDSSESIKKRITSSEMDSPSSPFRIVEIISNFFGSAQKQQHTENSDTNTYGNMEPLGASTSSSSSSSSGVAISSSSTTLGRNINGNQNDLSAVIGSSSNGNLDLHRVDLKEFYNNAAEDRRSRDCSDSPESYRMDGYRGGSEEERKLNDFHDCFGGDSTSRFGGQLSKFSMYLKWLRLTPFASLDLWCPAYFLSELLLLCRDDPQQSIDVLQEVLQCPTYSLYGNEIVTKMKLQDSEQWISRILELNSLSLTQYLQWKSTLIHLAKVELAFSSHCELALASDSGLLNLFYQLGKCHYFLSSSRKDIPSSYEKWNHGILACRCFNYFMKKKLHLSDYLYSSKLYCHMLSLREMSWHTHEICSSRHSSSLSSSSSSVSSCVKHYQHFEEFEQFMNDNLVTLMYALSFLEVGDLPTSKGVVEKTMHIIKYFHERHFSALFDPTLYSNRYEFFQSSSESDNNPDATLKNKWANHRVLIDLDSCSTIALFEGLHGQFLHLYSLLISNHCDEINVLTHAESLCQEAMEKNKIYMKYFEDPLQSRGLFANPNIECTRAFLLSSRLHAQSSDAHVMSSQVEQNCINSQILAQQDDKDLISLLESIGDNEYHRRIGIAASSMSTSGGNSHKIDPDVDLSDRVKRYRMIKYLQMKFKHQTSSLMLELCDISLNFDFQVEKAHVLRCLRFILEAWKILYSCSKLPEELRYAIDIVDINAFTDSNSMNSVAQVFADIESWISGIIHGKRMKRSSSSSSTVPDSSGIMMDHPEMKDNSINLSEHELICLLRSLPTVEGLKLPFNAGWGSASSISLSAVADILHAFYEMVMKMLDSTLRQLPDDDTKSNLLTNLRDILHISLSYCPYHVSSLLSMAQIDLKGALLEKKEDILESFVDYLPMEDNIYDKERKEDIEHEPNDDDDDNNKVENGNNKDVSSFGKKDRNGSDLEALGGNGAKSCDGCLTIEEEILREKASSEFSRITFSRELTGGDNKQSTVAIHVLDPQFSRLKALEYIRMALQVKPIFVPDVWFLLGSIGDEYQWSDISHMAYQICLEEVTFAPLRHPSVVLFDCELL